MLPIGGVLAGH